MQVRCPSCHHALEIVDDGSSTGCSCPACGGSLSGLLETRAPGAPLRAVAHFRLLEHVGRGHFGDVYRACDTRLDRVVALKVPRAQLDGAEAEGLFLREARAGYPEPPSGWTLTKFDGTPVAI